MGAYLQLARPLNCILAALAVAVSALIALGVPGLTGALLLPLALAMLTVALFTGAGNALNDYFDAESDRRNHPKRPIPSGRLDRSSALRFALLLFSLGLAATTMINPLALGLAALNLGVMALYESRTKGKGLPGNLSVSWLTGSIFIYSGAVYSGVPGISAVLLGQRFGSISVFALLSILALLAALSTLGREIAKDIEDMGGDTDRDTLPRRVGMKRAGTVALSAFIGAVALSPLPYLLGYFGRSYLFPVAAADAIFIYSGAIVFKDPSGASRLSKLAMALALAAFVVGGVLG